jgi:hypothetical protein
MSVESAVSTGVNTALNPDLEYFYILNVVGWLFIESGNILKMIRQSALSAAWSRSEEQCLAVWTVVAEIVVPVPIVERIPPIPAGNLRLSTFWAVIRPE